MNYRKVRQRMTFILEIAAVGLIAAIFVLLCIPAKGRLSEAAELSGAAGTSETAGVSEAEKAEASKKKALETVLAGVNPRVKDGRAVMSAGKGVEELEDSVKKKQIALTFDDGPTPTVTNRILDTLEKYQAKATFFVVGRQVEHDNDLLARAVEIGCEIGNHTWDHKNMTKYKKKALKQSIQKTEDIVKQYTGFDVSLVRPTYGKLNKQVKKNVARPMIYWNVDTLDWKTRDVKKIFSSIKNEKVKDGDIILMHDLYPATADALEKIVPYLQKEGYEFLTVSELMSKKGVALENGKVYYSSREGGK